MSKKLMLVLLVLSLSACRAKQNVMTEQNSNSGLPYTLISMPNESRVTIRIAWPSDWAFSEDRNQAAHYIGPRLLLTGGAEGYKAIDVEKRFSEMGSEGEILATIDYLLGSIHYSRKHQDETLKIINAHLRSPSLNEQWFDRIRDQLALEMNTAKASAESQVFEALRWTLFGEQPIRAALALDEHDVIELEQIKTADIATWVKSVIKRKGVVITIAGDLNADEAGAALDALFDGVPDGEGTEREAVLADYSPKRILLHAPESASSNLSFFGKLPGFKEGSELEDILITQVLSEYLDEILYGDFGKEARALYSYNAVFSAFTTDQRFILLTGPVASDNIADAETLLLKAYKEFRSNPPISEEDLSKLKEPHRERFKKFSKNTGSNSNAALMAKLHGMDPARALNLQAELDSVTMQTVKRRLQTAFPSVEEFFVLVDSPDATVLPLACIITTPEEALNC